MQVSGLPHPGAFAAVIAGLAVIIVVYGLPALRRRRIKRLLNSGTPLFAKATKQAGKMTHARVVVFTGDQKVIARFVPAHLNLGDPAPGYDYRVEEFNAVGILEVYAGGFFGDRDE